MNESILAIFGGLAAGVAHVLSGPDHLAAVLPFALRDSGRAVRAGMLWGLGHGLGVVVLGVLAMSVRAFVDLEALSNGSELVVAFVLIGMGVWSIRQSRLVVVHSHEHDHGEGPHTHTHSHAHIHVGDRVVHGRHPHAVLAIGMLHGVAGGSHLLGVLPSLALGRVAAAWYLASFLGGGLAAMGAFAFAAGRLVRKEAWLPRGLLAAGATSMLVGGFWLMQALKAAAERT